jgi:hypothetical protein
MLIYYALVPKLTQPFTMRPILLLVLLLGTGVQAFAQPFPTDPDSAQIVTTDIDNFWRAFDRAAPKFKAKVFQGDYLDKGSPGVAGFMRYRIESAKELAKTVKGDVAYYRAIRPYTLRIAEFAPEISEDNSCIFYSGPCLLTSRRLALDSRY